MRAPTLNGIFSKFLCSIAQSTCSLHLVRVLHNAGGDGSGYVVFVGVVAAPVAVVVNKTCFDEDGGHHGAPQNEEPRPFFQAPVRQVEDGLDIGLDTVPQHEAAGRAGNQRFRTARPAVEGIEVNTDKNITFLAVRFVTDSEKVIVLSEDDGDAIVFKIMLNELR